MRQRSTTLTLSLQALRWNYESLFQPGENRSEIFRAFVGEKMKIPEGNCQFIKRATLSSLSYTCSSAGMDAVPFRFHLLLWLSTSNLPYIYLCVWQGNTNRNHCLLVRVCGKGWFLEVCRKGDIPVYHLLWFVLLLAVLINLPSRQCLLMISK